MLFWLMLLKKQRRLVRLRRYDAVLAKFSGSRLWHMAASSRSSIVLVADDKQAVAGTIQQHRFWNALKKATFRIG
jgi:hypothetical protein